MKLIIRLSDWGVPGWLLKILIFYLTERTMVLKYNGEISSPQSLPGGSVQGSLIGIILFIVELSDAGMPVPAQMGDNDLISVPSPLPTETENEIRLKYVDDQTQGEVIQLNSALNLNGDKSGPQPYHNRHGHVLPTENSRIQTRLNQIEEYANIHKLKINETKTKIMAFNFSTKYDFLPELSVGENQLEVVRSTKLLGVIISSDLKWNEHTEYIVKKANKRLWYLRRLSRLGASRDTLLDQYRLICRSVLETAAPVFAGGLSQTNISDIEDVQRSAFKIILRKDYASYCQALALLGETTLEERRENISLKFAKKCTIHPKMKHLFNKNIRSAQ